MEEILNLIKDGKITDALAKLKANNIPKAEIDNLIKEFKLQNREIRDTQVGKIQQDKVVGEGEQRKVVKSVKTPASFQNKIVNTSTAFEFGKAVTLKPNEKNALSDEILRLWRVNRIDSKLQVLKQLQKSERQSALLFYIQDLKPNNLLNRMMGANNKKEIKSRVLENEEGTMSPTFDALGDMIFFTWEFVTKDDSGKSINNAWIYDDTNLYKSSDEGGTLSLISDKPILPHGFGKIPVVYLTQRFIEWDKVEGLIDRYEVSISKLGASNDYSGHPILKFTGEVDGAPEKDEDGKAFICKIKIDEHENVIQSDVEFLTHDNAPESVKMEQDRTEKLIYSLTHTPDISFENMKGIGNIAGASLELLFLDAQLKALLHEGENRTIVERMINVLISGTITTTNTAMKSSAGNTYFDVLFNSVVPRDLETIINTLSTGYENKIISQPTAVAHAGLTNDVEKELETINESVESPPE